MGKYDEDDDLDQRVFKIVDFDDIDIDFEIPEERESEEDDVWPQGFEDFHSEDLSEGTKPINFIGKKDSSYDYQESEPFWNKLEDQQEIMLSTKNFDLNPKISDDFVLSTPLSTRRGNDF